MNKFPSEAYRELCIEHQKELREEWEPKPGDWFLYPTGKGECDHSVLGSHDMAHWQRLPDHIPLPTLRQLIDMLEARRIDWKLSKGLAKIRLPGQAWADEKLTIRRGPDPETALLRAWLSLDPVGEVEKEE